mmetsp:Transcript_151994/g.487964  ORF Transcript_151994/g.487964 Transcript_151994/m.487964 type:complete len:591 (+) Transcript_151994:73-1845(+)
MEAHACADCSFDHALDLNKEGFSPLAAPEQFIRHLRDVFGDRFLRYLGMTYFGLKGIAFALLSSAMLPYFQLMGVSGNGFQLASVVARIPWSMKGMVGVLSDCFPLGRYHKRGYLLVASFVGCCGFASLALLPIQSLGPDQVWFVASLFCACNVLISTFDLLCEGKYSEMMRVSGAGSEVLTLVWTCMQAGALLAALITGLFVDTTGPQPLLALCLPIAALALWRTLAGDLPEQPRRSWASLRFKVRSQPRLFLLAFAMAFGGLLVAVAVVHLDGQGRAAVACAVSGVLIVGSFLSLPPTLAKGNLYMFLTSLAYMDVTGPLAYFYTGGTQCIEDGPHFSYSYYLAVSNVVGAAGSMLGAVLFQGMQDWTFQGAFLVTTFIQIFASVFDLMIVYRLNVALGISDAAAYLFGDAACQSMASMMAIMPMAMLTARLCPRGAEATVFAILAGFQNFGSSVGSIIGVQLTTYFKVEASAPGPCNFEGLGNLLILAHVISPLLCLPFIYFLVPSSRMNDTVAFDIASPAPSFCSPNASPPGSPRLTPISSPLLSPGAGSEVGGNLVLNGLHDTNDYCLMEAEDEEASGSMRRPFR